MHRLAEIAKILEDFKTVALLAGHCCEDVEVERRPAPHDPPKSLPRGKSAVHLSQKSKNDEPNYKIGYGSWLDSPVVYRIS